MSSAVHAATEQALASGRPVMEVLQETLQLTDDACVAWVGQQVGYETLTMADIHAHEPALELLAFSDMLRRECLLLRNAKGALILVVSNPFDQKLRQWSEGSFNFQFHRSDSAPPQWLCVL
jgi:general secretion pathway protein E